MGCSYVSGLAGCAVKPRIVHVIVGLMDKVKVIKFVENDGCSLLKSFRL